NLVGREERRHEQGRQSYEACPGWVGTETGCHPTDTGTHTTTTEDDERRYQEKSIAWCSGLHIPKRQIADHAPDEGACDFLPPGGITAAGKDTQAGSTEQPNTGEMRQVPGIVQPMGQPRDRSRAGGNHRGMHWRPVESDIHPRQYAQRSESE